MKVNVTILLVDKSVIRKSDIFDILIYDNKFMFSYFGKNNDLMRVFTERVRLVDIVSINLKFQR